MRKIGLLFRNIYRVFVVKPNGDRMVINCTAQTGHPEKDLLSDSTLRQIITADDLSFDAYPQIQKMLEKRVRGNDRSSTMAKNSLLEIFLPLFSLKQIEFKMAVISIALVITLGIGPANNHSPNRNLNLFFLADTLTDTSVYHLPAAHDTVFEILFK